MHETREDSSSNFCPAEEGVGRTEGVLPANVYIKIIAPQPDNFDIHYYQQSLEDRKHHGEIIKMEYTTLEPNQEITLQ